MEREILEKFFLYTFLIHFVVLLIWAGVFVCARDWVYRVHSRIFPVSKEQFYSIHYAGIAFYKILSFALGLGPYIVLKLL